MTGAQFPGWSAGPEISAREPTQPVNGDPDCVHPSDGLSHNCSQPSRIPNNPNVGADVDHLLGYRWNTQTATFEEIPFQVDERFTRYISNFASHCAAGAGSSCVGFGAYAAADAQLSYAYDRDSYRFTEGDCFAEMEDGDVPDPDPVKGLDDNDELAFLYRDAGQQAPPSAPLPAGVTELRRIRIDDPSAPDTAPRYTYVGLSAHTAKFTSTNSYMRYIRDADADRYAETSDNYGNAPKGPVCDDAGNVIEKKNNVPRRPLDTAWVLTPRYAFRYAGRWILRGVRVAPGDRDAPLDDPASYGPPLLDQWKARAYAQTRDDQVPCCGFENEQTNWGRSSVTLGELSGPVRVIRTTWGADSGTNTVRHEIFYPDTIVQQSFLRVHPIPPLGGIFSYWDHTAGVITKYYNPQRSEGVDVDGKNDEIVGTMHVDVRDDGIEVTDEDDIPVLGPTTVTVPPGGANGDCLGECANFDVNDPTLQATNVMNWEQLSGPHGTMVFRSGFAELTPGNAQGVAALPYYRDDACFDDGTGIDPGPARERSSDPVFPCWEPGKTATDGPFRQGLIGAHGVQLLFAAETDNAMLTAPVNEISQETRMVVLPGDPGNVGSSYALATDLPLQPTALDLPTIDPTTIEVTGDMSARMGSVADLAATLSDLLGPVANAPLHFSFQGRTYEATTDAQGKAAVADVPVLGPPGTDELVVTYSGDDLLRAPSYERADFTVQKGTTSVGFEPSSATSGKIGNTATFVAKLADSAGPMSGATLHFDFQDATHAATTDASGVASASFAVKGPAGPTTVTARYDGDGARGPSSASAGFTVTTRDSEISFSAKAGKRSRVSVRVLLTDAATSEGLGDRAVNVLVNGKRMATMHTDAEGRAKAKFKLAKPKGKTFRVEFASDDTHAGSAAQGVFRKKGVSASS